MADQPNNLSKQHGSWCMPELYDEFAPRGMQYAFSILRNRADSEDIVQEAFCRLLKSRPDSNSSGFAPLFFTTIRNLSIDRLRVTKRRKDVALDRVAEPVDTKTPMDDGAKLTEVVQTLISQLPAQWSEALKLRIDARLSYDEIAQVMNCTHAQVRTWIYRARREIETGLINEAAFDSVSAR